MVRLRLRPGHSLPELIVAVTLLGACLGAVGGTAVLGQRRTVDGVLRQEAVRTAAALLDSLLAAPLVQDGEERLSHMVVTWAVGHQEDALHVHVSVVAPDGRELVRLTAPWFPPQVVPPWPDGAES